MIIIIMIRIITTWEHCVQSVHGVQSGQVSWLHSSVSSPSPSHWLVPSLQLNVLSVKTKRTIERIKEE